MTQKAQVKLPQLKKVYMMCLTIFTQASMSLWPDWYRVYLFEGQGKTQNVPALHTGG